MRKILPILLFFVGLAWGQATNTCEDERYMKIKKKLLDEMSDREYAYFLKFDEKCTDYIAYAHIFGWSSAFKDAEETKKKSVVKSFATALVSGVISKFSWDPLLSDTEVTPTYVDGAQAASVPDAIFLSFDASSWTVSQAAPVGGQAITLFTFVDDNTYKVYYASKAYNSGFIVTYSLAGSNAVKAGGSGVLKAADAIGIDGNTFP